MVHGKRHLPLIILIPVAIALLVALVRPARGLDHGGVISSNESWLAADNPHVVTANVSVQAGVTLTLQPGVEVRFNGNRSLSIQGTLDATGTGAQPIIFTRNGTTNWSSVTLASAGQAVIAHAEIEFATYGVYKTSTGHLDLQHVDVHDCTYGLYLTGGTVDLTTVTATGCGSYGLYARGILPTFVDADCVFSDCGTGVYVGNLASTDLVDSFTVSNCTSTGLSIADCDDVAINNLVLNDNDATHGAILLDDCGDVALGAGNTISGNSWPVTLQAGSYLAAGSVVPASGNLENDIRVAGGASARSGRWRLFPGHDYVVEANPSISAGGSLTIDPAVTVRLNNNRTLSIAGQLVATASAGQEIQFVRNGTGAWSSLTFSGSGGGTLSHCLLDGATYGLYVNSSGTFDLSHVQATGCTYGIYATGAADITITDSQFSANSRGISSSSAALHLGSVDFVGNTHTGLDVADVMPTWLDDDLIFDGNATGCHLEDIAGVNLTTPFTFQDNTEVGLHLDGCDNPTVDNQTFVRNSGTHGALYVVDCGQLTLGSGNTIGGTGQENSWPLAVGAGAYPTVASVIPTSGNTRNDIRVSGGTSARSGTWPLFAGLDYVVMTNVTIQAGGEHILAPGVTVRLNNNRQFGVAGRFTAVGAPGQEIRLTREGTSAWSSLSFISSGSATLEDCILEGATYGLYVNSSGDFDLDDCLVRQCTYGIYCSSAANLSVVSSRFEANSYGISTNEGALELDDCEFVGNTNLGLRCQGVEPDVLSPNLVFDANATGMEINDVPGLALTTAMTFTSNTSVGLALEGCDDPTLDNLVFTGNTGADGAVMLVDCGEVTLGANNVIDGNSWPLALGPGAFPTAGSVIPTSGNENNDIRVRAGNSARTGHWRHFPGLDYVVGTNPIISAGGSLTIDAGNTVRFDNNRQISVQGELHIAGTLGNEVLCTDNGTSNWSGLSFSGSGGGSLAHCTVEGASYGVYFNTSGHLDLLGTTLTDNTYGIYAHTDGSLGLINSRIVDNTNYGLYRIDTDLQFGSDLSQWNDIHGNGGGTDGRDVHNHGETDVLAAFVHWGTMDWNVIEQHIHDQLDDVDLGRVTYVPFVSADHLTVIVGVDDEVDVPARFSLAPNHPNPFNPGTTIGLDLPRPVTVRLRVYDLRGALVATLLDGPMPAGRHAVVWRGQDDRGRAMASGVYTYRVEAGDDCASRTMTLIR